MKRIFLKISLMAVVALTATYQNANAKIWRVNNNPGKSGTFEVIPGEEVIVFGDLTSALWSLKRGGQGNIAEGDTIHIEGSVTAYGKATQTATNCDTIYKKVVIIGPGYMLSDNAETQHNKESAKIRTLHIIPAAAGTVIAGLEQVAPTGGTNFYDPNWGVQAAYYNCTYGINSYGGWGDTPGSYKIRIEADNVVISHCKLFYVDLFNKNSALTNITITKCVFNPGLIACAAGNNMVTNVIISNNFFKNRWNWGVGYWYQIIPSSAVIDFRGAANYCGRNDNTATRVWDECTFPVINPTIQNNTFYDYFNILAKGCQVFNNLFFPKNGHYGSFGLFKFSDRPHVMRDNIVYNVSFWNAPSAGGNTYNDTNYGGMLPGIDGNQYSNIAETSWFTSSTTLPALDKSFILSNGSPARSSDGIETKQRGMYGGLSPYQLSGLYTIPAVWEISIPSYPSGEVPSTGFEVRVRVKSH